MQSRNLETNMHPGRIPCKEKGRDQDDTATRQRLPANHLKLWGRGIKGSPLPPLEANNSDETLILDFYFLHN